MGLSWGHVGFQNRPGRVQGRKNRIPEAIRKKSQKKYQKTSVWEAPRREVRGGWVVNDALSGPTLKISRKQHLQLLEEFKTRSFKPSTYSKLEASSHQLKLLLHSRFHFQAPLALEMNNFSSQPGGPKGPADIDFFWPCLAGFFFF